MLHIASVCTPCYMLLDFKLLRVVQKSLKPVKLFSQQLPTFLLFRDRRSVAQQCWIRLHAALACKLQTFLLAQRRWGTFREEERLRLSDRNSMLMTQNLSRIRSEALIGRRSSFIVLAIVYEWQTKDKRRQRSNVNAMNLWQNSQYVWNKVFSRRSI